MEYKTKTTVTKVFTFDSAHFLPGYNGKCSNLHGHQWRLEVTVAGPPAGQFNIYPTMICDFGDIKKIVEDRIINRHDHQCLNDIYGEEQTTAENMSNKIFDNLFEIFGNNLQKIRLYETPNSYAEVTLRSWSEK